MLLMSPPPAITGAENDDKLVGEKGEILQGKQVRQDADAADHAER